MSNKSIKISVIIPAFNSENTIDACLDSVLSQSVKDIEVIVVDDGSIDKTYKLVKRRAAHDQRIVLVKQNNAGPSAARNRGIQLARGEFLNFVDADDIIFPGMFSSLLLYEKQYNADLVISGIRKVFKKRSGKRTIDMKSDKIYFFSDKEKICYYFIKMLNREAINNPVGRIYRTQTVKKFNLFFDEELDMGEDLRFNVDYIDKINSILIIPDIFYQYNLFNSTLTFKYRENLFEQRKRNVAFLKRFLEQNKIDKNIVFYFYIKLIYAVAMQELEYGNKLKKRIQRIREVLGAQEIQTAVKEYRPKKKTEKIMYVVAKLRSPHLIDLISMAFVIIRKSGMFYNHRTSI